MQYSVGAEGDLEQLINLFLSLLRDSTFHCLGQASIVLISEDNPSAPVFVSMCCRYHFIRTLTSTGALQSQVTYRQETCLRH